ncbi:hypothetical protein IFM89_010157 [Coptis chinensis]|uniref:PI4-kinase N-terminal domain-containing protein n=1 Tax=Coptis chinensis TaxID=261450 RepID=A0A835I759_9MAGN|nr:hypothetical protein IFM89_010157 [Coptis chinensis]
MSSMYGNNIKGRESEDPATKTMMKAMAARALWHLAKGNSTICKSITESRALLCFDVLLEKGSYEVQYNSAMTLIEIAAVISSMKWLEDELKLNALHNPGSRRGSGNEKAALVQRSALCAALGGQVEVGAMSAIAGYTIPVGWTVMICPPTLHLNPKKYEDNLPSTHGDGRANDQISHKRVSLLSVEEWDYVRSRILENSQSCKCALKY